MYKNKIKSLLVDYFLCYDDKAFCLVLEQLGISASDSIMIHSSWLPRNGFKGRPVDMINALKQAVTPSGLIIMPSLTYQNESSKVFLMRNQIMDVKRSASKMGLLSEVFRRGKDVHRSISPTHPILAWGEKAEWFVAGHEKAVSPFGKGSPFEKLMHSKGKILTIDASFSTITYTRFLEDRIASFLPFPLYDDDLLSGTVVDLDNNTRKVPVKVLSEVANRMRREQKLVAEMERKKLIKRKRIGNTQLMLIDCCEMMECVDEMVQRGMLFFDVPESVG